MVHSIEYVQTLENFSSKVEAIVVTEQYIDENGIHEINELFVGNEDDAATLKDCLKTDVDSVHSNNNKHKCTMCDCAVTHNDNLKTYVDSVHVNINVSKLLLESNASKNMSVLCVITLQHI